MAKDKDVGPRDSSTYRGARRNECFSHKHVWGPEHYFRPHLTKLLDPHTRKNVPYEQGEPRGKAFSVMGGIRNFFYPNRMMR